MRVTKSPTFCSCTFDQWTCSVFWFEDEIKFERQQQPLSLSLSLSHGEPLLLDTHLIAFKDTGHSRNLDIWSHFVPGVWASYTLMWRVTRVDCTCDGRTHEDTGEEAKVREERRQRTHERQQQQQQQQQPKWSDCDTRSFAPVTRVTFVSSNLQLKLHTNAPYSYNRSELQDWWVVCSSLSLSLSLSLNPLWCGNSHDKAKPKGY